MKQDQPSLNKRSFDCPYCRAYAHQSWHGLDIYFEEANPYGDVYELEMGSQGQGCTLILSVCASCRETAVWFSEDLVYPPSTLAPHPNADLPDGIREDYIEAADILWRSPRGAAALLRLCIDKLCAHLGKSNKTLNENIRTLVANGLSEEVQQALDIVRVIGNNAVHPGELDLKDDTETASTLFELINLIANEMITRPRQLDEAYNRLPKKSREAINRRDGK